LGSRKVSGSHGAVGSDLEVVVAQCTRVPARGSIVGCLLQGVVVGDGVHADLLETLGFAMQVNGKHLTLTSARDVLRRLILLCIDIFIETEKRVSPILVIEVD
jgi:hypothetical protein